VLFGMPIKKKTYTLYFVERF